MYVVEVSINYDLLTCNCFPSILQHNEVTLESHRQALPLSIFGDEELETDGSSIHEDISTHAAVSHQINTAKSPVPNISITDLISSLYSQVDQNTNATENPPHPASTVLESVLGDDDFDDDSWEFKDAVSSDQDQTSITNLEYSPPNSLTKVQLDNLVDFYCKLKDESYFLALRLLDNKVSKLLWSLTFCYQVFNSIKYLNVHFVRKLKVVLLFLAKIQQ